MPSVREWIAWARTGALPAYRNSADMWASFIGGGCLVIGIVVITVVIALIVR